MLNRDADEFSRGVAVAALALLAVWAEVPRNTILSYFAWLAREGLERRTNYVWSALAAESADIETVPSSPEGRAQRTVPLWQWEEVQEMLRSVTTRERGRRFGRRIKPRNGRASCESCPDWRAIS